MKKSKAIFTLLFATIIFTIMFTIALMPVQASAEITYRPSTGGSAGGSVGGSASGVSGGGFGGTTFIPPVTSTENSLTGSMYVYDRNGLQVSDISGLTNATVNITIEGTMADSSILYIALSEGDELSDVITTSLAPIVNSIKLEFNLTLPGTQDQTIKAFVWDKNNAPLMTPLTPESLNSVTLTGNIQAFGDGAKDSKWNYTGKYLSVYNEDTDATNKTYNLDDNAVIYLNGAYYKQVASATADYVRSINGLEEAVLGYVYAPTNGKVELVDTDNNGKYDIIRTTAYETVIMVDEPYANNTKIPTTAGSIYLDFEGIDNASLVLTIDGKNAIIADLKKDDVLSIAKSYNTDNYVIKASRATVSGMVTECDLAGSSVYEWLFVVDGTTYSLANIVDIYVTEINKAKTPGVEGIFYLDAFGKVAKFEATSASSQNYGFIVAAGEYASVGDKSYEVKILDKEGNTNTYTLAENMKIDNVAGKTAKEAYDAIVDLAAYKAGEIAWTFKDNGTYTTTNWETAMTDMDKANNYANRIVTFKLNSQNEVSTIDFVGGTGELTLMNSTTSAQYRKALSVIGNIGVDENTKIFALPINTTADKFTTITVDELTDKEYYNVAYYNVDENYIAKALVITNLEIKIPEEDIEEDIIEYDQGYGFIIAAGEYASVGDLSYEVKILDKDGNTSIYTLAENMKIDNISGKTAKQAFDKIVALAAYKAGEITWIFKDNGTYTDTSYGPAMTDMDKANNYANRIVTFKLNSQNEVSTIDFVGSTGDLNLYSTVSGAQYKETGAFIGNIGVNKNTTIFALPIPGTANKFTTVSVDDLTDKASYDVSYFNINENFVTNAVVITNLEIKIPEEDIEEDIIEYDQGYGFIIAAGKYASVGDLSYEVKILDKDGNTSIYTLAENMKIDNISGKTAKQAFDKIVALAAYKAGEITWIFKDNGTYTDTSYGPAMTDMDKANNYANRIVTFKLNSQNEVSTIDFVGGTGDLTLKAPVASKEYDAAANVFESSYAVDGNTVIFNLPISQTADKFSVNTTATLEDEEIYTVSFLNVEDNVAKVLVITNVPVSVKASQNLAIVTNCTPAVNANGDTIYNISFFQAGEEKTLATTEDVATALGGVLAKGTIFEYSVDDNGAIDAIAFNGTDDDVLTIAELMANPTMFPAVYPDPANKVEFAFGAVYTKNSSSRVIRLAAYTDLGTTSAANTDIANLGLHLITDDTPITIIDAAKSNTATNKVVLGTFGDIQTTKWINNNFANAYAIDDDRDYAALIKYYKDEILDVIIYKNLAK